MSEVRDEGITRRPVRTARETCIEPGADDLAVEAPLEVRVEAPLEDGSVERRSVLLLRTPGDDLALAAGLLVAEGVLAHPEELASLEPVEDAAGSVVLARLARTSRPSLGGLDRTSFVSSSCGACGKTSIAAVEVRRRHATTPRMPRLAPEVVHGLPEAMRGAQSDFARTGGVHAAGLFDAEGRLLSLREDVGRHNALDKVVGREFLAGRLPLRDRLVLVSGRAGFDLVQKAAMAGVPVLAAVGAPSSLAVDLARACGITLLGFVRSRRFNAYADLGRLADGVAGGRGDRTVPQEASAT